MSGGHRAAPPQCFSITARHNPAVRKVIAAIDEQAWPAVKFTNAIFNDAQQRSISEAEVAEIPYTAFASRATAKHVTARLIVRRVKGKNPAHQRELFAAYRYDAVFFNSPQPMLAAEAAHREHASVEQVMPTEKRAARPPAVGQVLGQQRLAGLRGDGLQPHPRRRRAGIGFLCQGDDGTIRAMLLNVPAGSPAPPAGPPCTCRRTGPGNRPGNARSPAPDRHCRPDPCNARKGQTGHQNAEDEPVPPATSTRPHPPTPPPDSHTVNESQTVDPGLVRSGPSCVPNLVCRLAVAGVLWLRAR